MYSCYYIFIFAFNRHFGIDFRNSMPRVGIVCRRNGIYSYRNSRPRLFLDKMSDVIFSEKAQFVGVNDHIDSRSEEKYLERFRMIYWRNWSE